MFRLIKLALYIFAGYKLYEYLQGMDLGGSMDGSGNRGSRREGSEQNSRGRFSHAQNMTGPSGSGRRVTVDTGESAGGHTEMVGRGVIRR